MASFKSEILLQMSTSTKKKTIRKMESQRNMYKHNHHFHNITQQILMNVYVYAPCSQTKKHGLKAT